ncbi:hypothetical protein F5141DRAFT_569744 [Pisolithus sp. B1]|nr:hypothetical protein F5141DRAFT_569744 [Pisolithus sp. B1]
MKPSRAWMFALCRQSLHYHCVPAIVTTVYEQFIIMAVQVTGGTIAIIQAYALYVESRRVHLLPISVILAAVGVGCVDVIPPVMSMDGDHDLYPHDRH